MKQQYLRAMDGVHAGCLFVAGACLIIITLIVPYGIFTRYVLNSAASSARAGRRAPDNRFFVVFSPRSFFLLSRSICTSAWACCRL